MIAIPDKTALQLVVRHLLADLPDAAEATERTAALARILNAWDADTYITRAVRAEFPERVTRVMGSEPEWYYYDNKKVNALRSKGPQ